MKISLSKKELIFLAVVLKKINLYGFEYDSMETDLTFDMNEDDIPEIKKSLEKKGLLKVVDNNKLNIIEDVHYIFLVWENSERTIALLEEGGTAKVKQFIFTFNNYMITMEKVWGEYYIELFKGEKETIEKLSEILNLNDINNEDVYNMTLTNTTLNVILHENKENNIDNLNKVFASLGFNSEATENLLEKINTDDSKYKKMIVTRNDRKTKSLIKCISDESGNFMFKSVDKILSKKIVLVKHTKEEIIKSILV